MDCLEHVGGQTCGWLRKSLGGCLMGREMDRSGWFTPCCIHTSNKLSFSLIHIRIRSRVSFEQWIITCHSFIHSIICLLIYSGHSLFSSVLFWNHQPEGTSFVMSCFQPNQFLRLSWPPKQPHRSFVQAFIHANSKGHVVRSTPQIKNSQHCIQHGCLHY